MADLAQILVVGVTQGIVYALLAMGIAVVYRTTRVLNFAHGELLTVGVFVMYVLVTNPLRQVPYPVACLAAIAVAVLLGLLLNLVAVRGAAWATALILALVGGWLASTRVGAVAWFVAVPVAVAAAALLFRRHVSGLRGSIGWILGTIAYATLLQEGLVAVVGPSGEPLRIPGPLTDLGVWHVGSVVIPVDYVATGAVALVLVVAVDLLESRTRFGRAMKAVAYDKDASALMGINVSLVVYTAFALAALTAVLAGLLVTPLTFAQPAGGPQFTLVALTGALLGGIDRVRTAALGGFVLGLVEIGLGRVLDAFGKAVGAASLLSLRNALVLVVLLLVLVARPGGLFGTPSVEPA